MTDAPKNKILEIFLHQKFFKDFFPFFFCTLDGSPAVFVKILAEKTKFQLFFFAEKNFVDFQLDFQTNFKVFNRENISAHFAKGTPPDPPRYRHGRRRNFQGGVSSAPVQTRVEWQLRRAHIRKSQPE